NDEQFRRCCRILNIDPGPDYATNTQRLARRTALSAIIREAMSSLLRDDLLAAFAEAGVPAGPINTVEQAFADPQVRHRGMALSMTRDDGTAVPGVRLPIRFSRSPLAPASASPRLGKG